MTRERERHARILCRIWDDDDWKARSPRAQWFYMLLISQASINRAGVIALTSKRWARLASGSAVEQQIGLAMDELEAEKFIIIDRDTEELLVRSYMRGDGVEKQPNVLKAACRQACEVLSPRIRAALEVEMRRLEAPSNVDAKAVLEATIEALPKGSDNPSPNPSPDGSSNGSPKGMGKPRGVGEGESLVGKGSTSTGGSSTRPRSQAKRGSRIPDDFTVSPEMAAWAREKVPGVDVVRATEPFVDYWRDKAGRDAVKLSWLGTWRNWMRREQEKAERFRSAKPNSTDANIHALLNPTGFAPLRALPGGAS